MPLQALCVNVGGRASDRIPLVLEQHAGMDVYCFLETMWQDGGWGELDFGGYFAYHCTRPAPLVAGRGRPSGGITVLVSEVSPLAASPLRVKMDATAGIATIASDVFAFTMVCCYFAPPNSAVYQHGLCDPLYLHTFFHGLQEAAASGHSVLCLGDFNIRTGSRDDDVTGAPLEAGPVQGLAQQLPGAVPAARQSCDRVVMREAFEFLIGLNACDCVLLNGRAPGDESGSWTCYHRDGRSVVDYGIVSSRLYPAVQSFRVCAFEGELVSQDHASLVVQLDLTRPLQQQTGPVGTRCPKTLRPSGDDVSGYIAALQDKADELRALCDTVEAGDVTCESAVDSMLGLVRRCVADTDGGRGQCRHSGSPAPWFDDGCRQARDSFKAAWLAWWRGKEEAADGGAALRDIMLATRRRYRRATGDARRQFRYDCMQDLLTKYYSEQQRDFWARLKGSRRRQGNVVDADLWTQHFTGIMGTHPAPQFLSQEHADLRQRVFDGCRRDADVFDCLNAPVTQAEVCGIMRTLPSGKAADLQGLTCELFKCAAGQSSESDEAPSCPELVACVTAIVQRVLHNTEGVMLPRALQDCKVVPVPKPQAAQSPGDLNNYRPIGVGSIVNRVIDRLMQQRLGTVVERAGVRAHSQCGFRDGHGCLDALFVLHHLHSRVQSARSPRGTPRPMLWMVFVDFAKAFDLVRRDLLVERCRQLGVHGPFLDALTSLYERVCIRVCAGGRLGPALETHRGTRQGSELSPLLFGLFMDMLSELIKLQVPGAGPTVGCLRVPDLEYADDVTLMAWSREEAQQLLDCLDLFCTLFDMTVNLDKTHALVLRRPGGMPAGGLSYRGQPVPVAESAHYLGLTFGSTRGFTLAGDELARKGQKSMFGLFPLLRLHHIAQNDLRLRLFDTLVEPVLSYGAQIWGPAVCRKQLCTKGKDMCAADNVQLTFLREMYGAHKSTSREVLLRDAHRDPMPFRWLSLAAGWWAKLAGMGPERLARQAWVADIALMLSGCKQCWTHQLLECLERVGYLPGNQWRRGNGGVTVSTICSLVVTKKGVHDACLRFQRASWDELSMQGSDPRTGPSVGIQLRTHMAWVHSLVPDGPLPSRANAPVFHKLCLPRSKLQCAGRYRLGGHHLEGRMGRRDGAGNRVERAARLCVLCSGLRDFNDAWPQRILDRCGRYVPEDLLHFVLECPAFDHIRDRFSGLFQSLHCASAPLRLRSLFEHRDQALVADCLAALDRYRCHLLGKRVTHSGLLLLQPAGYVPVGSGVGLEPLGRLHTSQNLTSVGWWWRWGVVSVVGLVLICVVALIIA
jgi:hypothetical protein